MPISRTYSRFRGFAGALSSTGTTTTTATTARSRAIASSVVASSPATLRPTISLPSSRFSAPVTTAASPIRFSSVLTNPPRTTFCPSSALPRNHMSFLKKFFSSSSPETMAKANEKAQKLIDESNVVVFSKSYCPYCRSTKQALKELGADYTLVELDQESDGDDIQDAVHQISGQRTVPNVYIAKKHIGGNSDVQALKSKGQLASLLKSAGAIAA